MKKLKRWQMCPFCPKGVSILPLIQKICWAKTLHSFINSASHNIIFSLSILNYSDQRLHFGERGLFSKVSAGGKRHCLEFGKPDITIILIIKNKIRSHAKIGPAVVTEAAKIHSFYSLSPSSLLPTKRDRNRKQ